MADESVGSVFLDLVVRDTVNKQVQAMAQKAQATTQKSFAGMEQAISAMVEKSVAKTTKATTTAASSISKVATRSADAAQKAVQAAASSATSCGQQVENTIGQSFSRSVAIAQSKVTQLEKSFDAVGAKLDSLWQSDSFDPASKATQRLLTQQESLMAKLEAAQERLAIEVLSAAQKRAAAEQVAARKTAAAAQKAAAAQEREARKNEIVQQKIAHGTAKAHEQSASRIKNAFSKAFSGVRKMTGGLGNAISGIKNKLSAAGKSATRFGTRLKGIISGALVFNLLSSALRKMTDYLGTAVSSSSEMKDALSNLKGAAMTAAQPIVEMLTPALTALANGAATVLSYLTRLISFFTGKSVSAMSSAAKKIQSTATTAKKAMASLAGFDEIQRLDGNDSSDGSGETAEIKPNFDFQGQSSFLDSVMESVKAGNWGDVGALLSKKLNSCLKSINWPSIQEKASSWASGLAEGINGFVRNLDWANLGTTLSTGLETALDTLTTFVTTFDWGAVGRGIADGLNNIDVAGISGKLGTLINATLVDIPMLVIEFLANLNWANLGYNTVQGIKNMLQNIEWSQVVATLFKLLGASIAAPVSFTIGIGQAVWELLKLGFEATKSYFNTYIEEAGGDVIQGLKNGIVDALKSVGSWIVANIWKPFIDGFKSAFGIHSPSKKMAEQGDFIIQGLLQGISGAWTSITTFFTNAFETVKKNIVDKLENGIVPAIKNPINSIIGFINGLISGVCSGVNTIIKAMNKLKWDVPDWVPVLGGKTFGFNLKTIAAPQIPMLANGGVITQPTLAMMGEYSGARNNPEIAAPQSLIEQTLTKAMAGYSSDMVQCFEAVVDVLKEILEAIYGIDGDRDAIYDYIKDKDRRMAIIRGGTL